MRQLATIQKIISVEPIEGYDRVEKITVLGWELTALKGEFKVGDFCVFAEPDSIFPRRPEFEFLSKYKYRIKARRIGSIISQGIALPLDILVQAEGVTRGWDNLWLWKSPTGLQGIPTTEEAEVTDLLGIMKWELPEEDTGILVNGKPGKSKKKNEFPSDLRRTDETRLQAVMSVLKDLQGVRCYIAQKADGSSMNCYLRLNEQTGQFDFGVCSRNQEKAESDTCHFWYTARKHKVEEKMRTWLEANPDRFPKGFSLAGENVGKGIQKNRMGIEDFEFLIFNLFDIGQQQFMNYQDLVNLVQAMELKTVLILNDNFVIGPTTTFRTFMEIANHKYSGNTDSWAEGIVVRPVEEMKHRKLGRLSFKIISENFLLQHGL
jgi:RNA ligase (TIGR02306 family)